jgi:hypothetical protein
MVRGLLDESAVPARVCGSAYEKRTRAPRLAVQPVVCLMPAHRYTVVARVRCCPTLKSQYLRGRIRFNSVGNSAPFPSVVIVFRPASMESRLGQAV